MPLLTKINTNVIADNAVTAAKTSGTAEQELTTSANIDLSGTTTGQKLQLGDAFTLTGDLTVNHDLVLGKVRDDGTGQSLTGDGKTLTGTGTLTMGSSFEGGQLGRDDKTTSVTGLPGVLGSDVNLDNATFPSRHIVQVQFAHSTASVTASGADALAVADSITLSSSSNLILAVATIAGKSYTSSGQTSIYTGMKMISSGTGVTAQTLQQTPQDGTGTYGIGITQLASNGILYGLWTSQFIFTPVLKGTVTISAYLSGYSSTHGLVSTNENTSGSGRVDGGSTITLYEILP